MKNGVLQCPHCGIPNKPNRAFCRMCGLRLSERKEDSKRADKRPVDQARHESRQSLPTVAAERKGVEYKKKEKASAAPGKTGESASTSRDNLLESGVREPDDHGERGNDLEEMVRKPQDPEHQRRMTSEMEEGDEDDARAGFVHEGLRSIASVFRRKTQNRAEQKEEEPGPVVQAEDDILETEEDIPVVTSPMAEEERVDLPEIDTLNTEENAELDMDSNSLDNETDGSLDQGVVERVRAVQGGLPPPHAGLGKKRRVRTYIQGLDEALRGGIPAGHVVLIAGSSGTYKSSLAYWILYMNALMEQRRSLYITMEQSYDSLMNQMRSMGLDTESATAISVFDVGYLQKRFGAEFSKKGWLQVFKKNIMSLRGKKGLDLLVIDSLPAFEILADFKERRKEIFRLFQWLKDLGLTTFVIAERPDFVINGNVIQGHYVEDFLADGIFHLRLHLVSDSSVQRRIRCVKMREANHSDSYMALVFDDGQFKVARAMGR